MRWFHSEPTIAEMLSDPIIRALMAADRVAPEELHANLTKLAGTLEPRHSMVSQRDCSCGSSLG
jgi:predicted component of type VI protein secretion system